MYFILSTLIVYPWPSHSDECTHLIQNMVHFTSLASDCPVLHLSEKGYLSIHLEKEVSTIETGNYLFIKYLRRSQRPRSHPPIPSTLKTLAELHHGP